MKAAFESRPRRPSVWAPRVYSDLDTLVATHTSSSSSRVILWISVWSTSTVLAVGVRLMSSTTCGTSVSGAVLAVRVLVAVGQRLVALAERGRARLRHEHEAELHRHADVGRVVEAVGDAHAHRRGRAGDGLD